MSAARITFYTRPGCHLCDEARAVIEAVCAELGESYVEVDVDDEPALLARFKQPSRVEVVDELPLTVTGKVQKGLLRGIERRRAMELLEGAPPASPSTPGRGATCATTPGWSSRACARSWGRASRRSTSMPTPTCRTASATRCR